MKNEKTVFSFHLLIGIISVLLSGGCAKDNRVVLHSESIGNSFSIKKSEPSFNVYRNTINKSKLAVAIAKRVGSISEIYDISDKLDEGWLWSDTWYVFFTAKTNSGKVYEGFRCLAVLEEGLTYDGGVPFNRRELVLRNCATDGENVQLSNHEIRISLASIMHENSFIYD